MNYVLIKMIDKVQLLPMEILLRSSPCSILARLYNRR